MAKQIWYQIRMPYQTRKKHCNQHYYSKYIVEWYNRFYRNDRRLTNFRI